MTTPQAVLHALADLPAEGASLPRLAKRLGVRASSLLRVLAGMGGASVAGVAGPGWVEVTQADGQWTVRLTEAGRGRLAQCDPTN